MPASTSSKYVMRQAGRDLLPESVRQRQGKAEFYDIKLREWIDRGDSRFGRRCRF